MDAVDFGVLFPAYHKVVNLHGLNIHRIAFHIVDRVSQIALIPTNLGVVSAIPTVKHGVCIGTKCVVNGGT